jgi:RecA/RadA recombinase
MSNFFRDLIAEVKDEDTSILSDGKGSAEYTNFIDTGCFVLNGLISGKLKDGGMANTKILGLAAESSTGKTFVAMGIVKSFLQQNPDGGVVYFDTEAAVTSDMFKQRGIDPARVIISEPDTLQKFKTTALKFIDKYMETPKNKRPPMMFVLDSLGMLSSSKELEDSAEGKDTRDMTKAQLVRAIFRVLTLKLAKANIPMIVTNHVYASIGGMFPENIAAGGGGFKYACSTILSLGKAKDKDGTEVVGVLIRVKTVKSRLTKENNEVRLRLSYKTGLDRYYGLLELAEKYGIFKKVSTRYELPDGKKVFGKSINDNPEEYYTPEIMELLEQAAQKEFMYGISDGEPSEEIDEFFEEGDVQETEKVIE